MKFLIRIITARTRHVPDFLPSGDVLTRPHGLTRISNPRSKYPANVSFTLPFPSGLGTGVILLFRQPVAVFTSSNGWKLLATHCAVLSKRSNRLNLVPLLFISRSPNLAARTRLQTADT